MGGFLLFFWPVFISIANILYVTPVIIAETIINS